MKLTEKGFSAVEAVLIFVIVAILGGTGFYVYRANKNANATLKSADEASQITSSSRSDCSGISYKGELYTAPGNTYSVCIPNGWKVYYNGDKAGSSLEAEQQGMVYSANKKPVIGKTGGKDGGFPFSIVYEASLPTADYLTDLTKGFTQTGSISAQNVNGTTYYHLTGNNDSVGGGIRPFDEGTKQYVYVFQKDSALVIPGYNIFPGDTDQTALVQDVVKSLKLQ